MSVEFLAATTPEQVMLLDASAKFIEAVMPLAKVRDLAEASAGPAAAYFEAAGALGWFGLLVDERLGGGSASGNGLLDAAAIAAERGAVLQPGPFVGMNVAADALAGAGPAHQALLAELIAGRARVTWVAGAVAGLTPGAGEVAVRGDGGADPAGDGYRLDGTVRHVADALDCDAFLVTAREPDGGLKQLLVEAGAPGVEVRRMDGLDLTRRMCAVRFQAVRVGPDAVVASPGRSVEERFAHQVRIAAILTAAESVGAMHRDFTMTLEYARTRIAFGRPIGSFQAVKHQLADLSLSLEMAKGLVAAAADAFGGGASDGGDLAHAAKAFVAERGVDLAHGCFQVLGGIGYTWEHDHHLFMRRLAADGAAFGSADWHRARLGDRIGAA